MLGRSIYLFLQFSFHRILIGFLAAWLSRVGKLDEDSDYWQFWLNWL